MNRFRFYRKWKGGYWGYFKYINGWYQLNRLQYSYRVKQGEIKLEDWT